MINEVLIWSCVVMATFLSVAIGIPLAHWLVQNHKRNHGERSDSKSDNLVTYR